MPKGPESIRLNINFAYHIVLSQVLKDNAFCASTVKPDKILLLGINTLNCVYIAMYSVFYCCNHREGSLQPRWR